MSSKQIYLSIYLSEVSLTSEVVLHLHVCIALLEDAEVPVSEQTRDPIVEGVLILFTEEEGTQCCFMIHGRSYGHHVGAVSGDVGEELEVDDAAWNLRAIGLVVVQEQVRHCADEPLLPHTLQCMHTYIQTYIQVCHQMLTNRFDSSQLVNVVEQSSRTLEVVLFPPYALMTQLLLDHPLVPP